MEATKKDLMLFPLSASIIIHSLANKALCSLIYPWDTYHCSYIIKWSFQSEIVWHLKVSIQKVGRTRDNLLADIFIHTGAKGRITDAWISRACQAIWGIKILWGGRLTTLLPKTFLLHFHQKLSGLAFWAWVAIVYATSISLSKKHILSSNVKIIFSASCICALEWQAFWNANLHSHRKLQIQTTPWMLNYC